MRQSFCDFSVYTLVSYRIMCALVLEIQTFDSQPVSIELSQLDTWARLYLQVPTIGPTTNPVINRAILGRGAEDHSVECPLKVQAGATLLKRVRITPRDLSSL